MTDSMNFGPDWIRNLSSEGSTGGGTSGGSRYQLADFRYGREEMLALFDRHIKPPACLVNFKRLYSETTLPPLALLPTSDEERGNWQGGRPLTLGGPPRGRGGSMERGGRPSRGRGGYQSYGRPSQYESGWGNGEPSEWSPRKDYPSRPVSMDNWRRARNNEEDDGWRMSTSGRGMNDKWARQSSWRGEGEDERTGPPERGGRTGWQEVSRGGTTARKSWDEDHLPEWVNEHPLESGGTFDDRGAFHGSEDEQEGRLGGPKRDGLQKSTSQQHISHKSHPPLLTSKSTMSLVKDNEAEPNNEQIHQDMRYLRPNPNTNPFLNMMMEQDNGLHSNSESSSKDPPTGNKERKLSVPEVMDQAPKEVANNRDRAKSEGPQKSDVQFKHKLEQKSEENEFEKLQEDFVSKLVVDEEPPNQNSQPQNNIDMSNMAPPPNLAVPGQDKWFYQDPQGQMQGPFTNIEMSEWLMAGYFGHDLKVRRQCDERFFLLGELIAMCNSNPFQTNVQFPVLKNDISKMPDHDLQFQYLPQIEAYKQAQARVLADPWSAIAVQQQELAAQRLIMQQQQVQQDIQYLQRQPPSNPFMHMLSQMQQANKLPPTGLMDKHPPNIPGGAINPHLHMHMSNFLSMQSRLPGGVPGQITGGLPAGIPAQMGPNNIAANLSALPRPNMVPAGMPLQGGLSSGMGLNVSTASSVDHNVNQNSDPITKLLKQLQQETQQQQQNLVESLWQQNQFGVPNSNAPPQQWPGAPQPEMPLSMWDVQPPPQTSSPPEKSSADLTQENGELPVVEKEKTKKTDKARENRQKEDEKELKKKKKAEEEQQKKEAEEKRKQEQRKLEMEKKAEAEKKKKEEEKIKKELEKAKKEAEDKRLKELEEKRRLKEQRKLEEEAKKRTDEERRKLEEDRMQREKEQREREERQRAEERRQEQISMAKAAPWSQANSTFGMSLAEIQKAEKERKAQDAILQAQKVQMERALQVQQQQQLQLEKSGGIQLGWAKKAMEPRKVKSLAEIQAEEQERLIKEAAEARLKKEKETRDAVPIQQVNSIWSGQSLPWANSSSTQSQWSSATNISGFWDEPTQKPHPVKPSIVSKSSSMSTISSKQVQPAKQAQKTKSKKDDEAPANSKKNNNSNERDDDFTTWCYKALSNIDTSVDIPTFVSFLRDIESAFEVREYCKEYLGEGNATQQFTNNFLEKRRSFKQKNAHKDDMCSPAPAITPSLHNTSEFQEVKGKNKKTKKSKMLKVDSRILGFNVTSASDRINVGDRDYGDNS